MISPLGNRRRLVRVELEDGPVAYRCPESGGCWIPASHYWSWRSRRDVDDEQGQAPICVPDDPAADDEEIREAKLCPETGTIMIPYRIGHGVRFRIDRSITGGIWLDGGEWDALKQHGLHEQIHLVFSAPWQRALREKARDDAYRHRLVDRLGSELVADLDALKARLAGHPHRSLALAWLDSEP